MEDQGKRLLIAVAMVFGLMMVWNFLFPPETPKPDAENKDGSAEVESAESSAAKGEKPTKGDSPQTDDAGQAEAPRGEEVLLTVEHDKFKAVFSSYGGILKEWSLNGEKYFDKDANKQIDLVRTSEPGNEPFHTVFTGSGIGPTKSSEWVGEKISETEVVFRWKSEEFQVEKRFVLQPENYVIELSVDFKNLGSEELKQSLEIQMSSYQDPSADDEGGWGRLPRTWNAGCFVNGEVEDKTLKDLRKKDREWVGTVQWVGFVHPYFITAIAPRVQASDNQRLRCVAKASGDAGEMTNTLVFPSLDMAPGDPALRWSALAYVGPKYLEKLDYLDEAAGFKTHLREAVDLGFLGFLARPLLWLLKKFHSVVGNWGLAIILLTLLVKTLLLPWTHKSMKSMKKMSKLAPKMKALQEEHKDDKQVQQQKVMELYKSEGVNPLAGCLPMLLQMPIWFALYRMLTLAAELYQAPFIPGWIDDLVSPDPIYVMPVLLTVTMFMQSRLTASAATGMQQKMLMYGMPLMFGAFSFVFPSGLTLYIFTNTVLTGVHHLILHKGEKAADKAKVVETSAPKPDAEDKKSSSGKDPKPDGSSQSTPSSGSRSGKKSGKKSSKKKGKRRR